jgi:hypothetical protein
MSSNPSKKYNQMSPPERGSPIRQRGVYSEVLRQHDDEDLEGCRLGPQNDSDDEDDYKEAALLLQTRRQQEEEALYQQEQLLQAMSGGEDGGGGDGGVPVGSKDAPGSGAAGGAGSKEAPAGSKDSAFTATSSEPPVLQKAGGLSQNRGLGGQAGAMSAAGVREIEDPQLTRQLKQPRKPFSEVKRDLKRRAKVKELGKSMARGFKLSDIERSRSVNYLERLRQAARRIDEQREVI